ncbi:hypothetical protein EOI86_04510 [Hwanghaeella grinnelliae]|uniref:Uncharacterized protein n=1 Tax=Hwanghaeella grinnelliae TaxID=2500179 RepID=A0A437QVK4_9PROT|nr:hypothetical protein [Hwanghaeella grinnelliae]RVU38550.1 hypothetical protein EOI86_04510 [Hwanghaeella grinnelliae]
MKIDRLDPPRQFSVKGVAINHVADMHLDKGEMVTFKTPSEAEYDVTAKDWGFYATPSTNGRLKNHGFRTALARSEQTGMRYVLLVEASKMEAFEAYCREQDMVVDLWLDEDV